MQHLELFHGGEAPVSVSCMASPKSTRPLDFGSGFYTTTSREQADRWIGIRLRQHVYAKGFVSRYILDLDMASVLRVCNFDAPDEAWFDFVMANRRNRDFMHDFHSEAALGCLRYVDAVEHCQ